MPAIAGQARRTGERVLRNINTPTKAAINLHLRGPMAAAPDLQSTVRDGSLELVAAGTWTLAYAGTAEELIRNVEGALAGLRRLTIDMAGVRELDTLGAWLFERLLRNGRAAGLRADLAGLPDRFGDLLKEMEDLNRRRGPRMRPLGSVLASLNAVGVATVSLW